MTSDKKKIIVIGPAYPYRGGNALFVSHVYDALKEDFEVKIFNYSLLYPAILFPGKTQYDESTTLIKKAPNERLVNSISPFSWLKVAFRIIKENPDLVVFDWWHPFFAPCHFTISGLIKKKLRKKILFITENFVSHEGNFIDKRLTDIGLKNASAFLVLSQIVENEVNQISSGRKVYKSELPIYDCYDSKDKTTLLSSKKDLGFTEKDNVLLFFGYVRKYKGLDLLIEAFPAIKSFLPNAKLLIVGEFYDSPNVYIDQIKKLGIDKDTVVVNKFVPNEDVGKYYNASDLVVLPYRSATQSGILNVAYGFSKPVLVTNVGGLSEFVENNKTGIIIKPNSPQEIADGVKEYFKLKESVDFEKNIKDFVNKNNFGKLPQLFNQIISDTQI
ncbi:MAG: glycosyltransferase family 4 protein [Ignavibacteriaceae bacterium]|nr:glycosyltransferase family 4 protein [Ignavibacteriaceae bacterium]